MNHRGGKAGFQVILITPLGVTAHMGAASEKPGVQWGCPRGCVIEERATYETTKKPVLCGQKCVFVRCLFVCLSNKSKIPYLSHWSQLQKLLFFFYKILRALWLWLWRWVRWDARSAIRRHVKDAAEGAAKDVAQDLAFGARAARALPATPRHHRRLRLFPARAEMGAQLGSWQLSGIWLWVSASGGAAQSTSMLIDSHA